MFFRKIRFQWFRVGSIYPEATGRHTVWQDPDATRLLMKDRGFFTYQNDVLRAKRAMVLHILRTNHYNGLFGSD